MTSMTERSVVMVRCTRRLPVSGRLHSVTIFELPSFAMWSIITMTCLAP